MNKDIPASLASFETINPYRRALKLALDRLRWDLRLESWLSRQQLRKLRDSQANKKGLILCNGPSLNAVDFDSLNDSRGNLFVFGLNKINLLFERTRFRPDAIVAVNEYVIDQNSHFYDETDIMLFLEKKALRYVRKRPNITYLDRTAVSMFARDVSISIFEGFTVTYVAMQLAFHLGIRDVALVGCDHSFSQKGPRNSVSLGCSEDPDHFDPKYFAGQQWQRPDLIASEYYYTIARETFEESGGCITNCTEGGKLEVFRRKDLESWLR